MSTQERRLEYALRKVFDRMFGTRILDLEEVGKEQGQWVINKFIFAQIEEVRKEGTVTEFIFSFSFKASAELGPQDERNVDMGGAFLPQRGAPKYRKNQERIY